MYEQGVVMDILTVRPRGDKNGTEHLLCARCPCALEMTCRIRRMET